MPINLNFTEAAAILSILCTMDETGRNDTGPTATYLVDRLITHINDEEIEGALDILITRTIVLEIRPRVSAREVQEQLDRAIRELRKRATQTPLDMADVTRASEL